MIDADRHPLAVAHDLLGATIACRGTAAVIVEVEAYHQDEEACHAYGGVPTPRTRDLFGPPGTLYVYFTYGMHWCANVVTCADGVGAAVLLRAAIPVHGESTMRVRRATGQRRTLTDRDLCSGPAKLVQALDIRAADSGAFVLAPPPMPLDAMLIESTERPVIAHCDEAVQLAIGLGLPEPAARQAITSTRIGISKATELPWRVSLDAGRWPSRPAR